MDPELREYLDKLSESLVKSHEETRSALKALLQGQTRKLNELSDPKSGVKELEITHDNVADDLTPAEEATDIVPDLAASAASAKPLEIDVTSIAAPTPTSCSTDGINHNVGGDDPMAACQTAWSTPTSLAVPLGDSPTLSSELTLVLEPDALAPTKCSTVNIKHGDNTTNNIKATMVSLLPSKAVLVFADSKFVAGVCMLWPSRGRVAEWQPWPPPWRVWITHKGLMFRPRPWPSFVRSQEERQLNDDRTFESLFGFFITGALVSNFLGPRGFYPTAIYCQWWMVLVRSKGRLVGLHSEEQWSPLQGLNGMPYIGKPREDVCYYHICSDLHATSSSVERYSPALAEARSFSCELPAVWNPGKCLIYMQFFLAVDLFDTQTMECVLLLQARSSQTEPYINWLYMQICGANRRLLPELKFLISNSNLFSKGTTDFQPWPPPSCMTSVVRFCLSFQPQGTRVAFSLLSRNLLYPIFEEVCRRLTGKMQHLVLVKFQFSLSWKLQCLVLVAIRKEAVIWLSFQYAPRHMVLLLPWDPGAPLYDRYITFQDKKMLKWKVSSAELRPWSFLEASLLIPILIIVRTVSGIDCLGALLHILQGIDDQLAEIMFDEIETQVAVHLICQGPDLYGALDKTENSSWLQPVPKSLMPSARKFQTLHKNAKSREFPWVCPYWKQFIGPWHRGQIFLLKHPLKWQITTRRMYYWGSLRNKSQQAFRVYILASYKTLPQTSKARPQIVTTVFILVPMAWTIPCDPGGCTSELGSSTKWWTTPNCSERFQWPLPLLACAPQIGFETWAMDGTKSSICCEQASFHGGRSAMLRAAFSDHVLLGSGCYIPETHYYDQDSTNLGPYIEDYHSRPNKIKELHSLWDPGESALRSPSKMQLGGKQSFMEGGVLEVAHRQEMMIFFQRRFCCCFNYAYYYSDQVHVDHHYYLDTSLEQVPSGYDYYIKNFFDLVQVDLNHGYYCNDYHGDFGTMRDLQAPWDPGKLFMATAWGQAVFQEGRGVSDLPVRPSDSPRPSPPQARAAHGLYIPERTGRANYPGWDQNEPAAAVASICSSLYFVPYLKLPL